MNTPGRKPLSILQRVAKSGNQDGTPSKTVHYKHQHEGNGTPVSHRRHARRKSKRKSMPLLISKAFPVNEDEMLTRRTGGTGTPTVMSRCLLDNSQDTCLSESKLDLNEMVREKVLKTVNKIRQVGLLS